jgi:hypothetical protein
MKRVLTFHIIMLSIGVSAVQGMSCYESYIDRRAITGVSHALVVAGVLYGSYKLYESTSLYFTHNQ